LSAFEGFPVGESKTNAAYALLLADWDSLFGGEEDADAEDDIREGSFSFHRRNMLLYAPSFKCS